MQHPIPVRGVDADPVALVKMVLDSKQGLPNQPAGTGSAKYSLNKDMGRYHRLLDTIVGRAASKCFSFSINTIVLNDILVGFLSDYATKQGEYMVICLL